MRKFLQINLINNQDSIQMHLYVSANFLVIFSIEESK